MRYTLLKCSGKVSTGSRKTAMPWRVSNRATGARSRVLTFALPVLPASRRPARSQIRVERASFQLLHDPPYVLGAVAPANEQRIGGIDDDEIVDPDECHQPL